MLHIFTEKLQPATNWTDNHGPEPMRGGFDPEEVIYTECCKTKRPAKDCVVQCYYDGLSVFCADGHGCKDPVTIAKKKAEQSLRRSIAQKKRFARELQMKKMKKD